MVNEQNRMQQKSNDERMDILLNVIYEAAEVLGIDIQSWVYQLPNSTRIIINSQVNKVEYEYEQHSPEAN